MQVMKDIVSLFGDAVHRYRASNDKADRMVVLRSMLAPRVSARWSQFIRRYHQRVGAGAPAARVLAKPLRSYVHRALGPAQRLRFLVDHYERLDQAFAASFIRALCRGEALRVATLQGRKGSVYGVFVAASVTSLTQREGELVIYLAKGPADLQLSRLSLCLGSVKQRQTVVVGGLQGPLGGHKGAVIAATRDLHGLRPKDAVFLAARAMALALSDGALHAISDANHVLNRLQDVAKFSGYDAYWLERGGVAGGPFGFVFDALGKTPEPANARDAAKSAIVSGMALFIDDNRRRDKGAANTAVAAPALVRA